MFRNRIRCRRINKTNLNFNYSTCEGFNFKFLHNAPVSVGCDMLQSPASKQSIWWNSGKDGKQLRLWFRLGAVQGSHLGQ